MPKVNGKFPVHSYPWYVQDWRNSRARMTMNLEQRGFYRELIDFCTTEGPFRADSRTLASIAGCQEKTAARLWISVAEKFVQISDGEWVNEKSSLVRGAIQQRKKKQSIGRKLVIKSKSTSSQLGVNSKLREGEGDGEGEGEVVAQKEKDSSRSKFPPFHSELQRRQFDEFWKVYWLKVAKKPAQKAFAGAVTSLETHQAVMAAISAQCAAMLARYPEKRPHAATWLSQERWKDEAPPSRGHIQKPKCSYCRDKGTVPQMPNVDAKTFDGTPEEWEALCDSMPAIQCPKCTKGTAT